MNDYVDLHTHTIASGHAYSTIEAMIKAAEQKGIRLFGITEHAPEMPGTCSGLYFNNLCVLERKHGEMQACMVRVFIREPWKKIQKPI